MSASIKLDAGPILGHVDVVEDDDSLRISITNLLRFAGYEVRCWRDAVSFLSHLPQSVPAVIVTDMRMAGMTGLELHAALLTQGRRIPIIYMSGESSISQGIQAMKLGAVDFLVKPFSREDLLKAVIAGLEKDRVAMRKLIERRRFEEQAKNLSPRELQVLHLLLKGYSNTEIVTALNISLPTAKQYKSQIMAKTGVRSLSQLMQLSRKDEDEATTTY